MMMSPRDSGPDSVLIMSSVIRPRGSMTQPAFGVPDSRSTRSGRALAAPSCPEASTVAGLAY
ncbi:MAG: hypothetical protein ACJ8AW_13935 [Rhodopila sp.]